MPRATRPRTTVAEGDVPSLYSHEAVQGIAGPAGIENPNIPKLQRSLIACVTAYLKLLAQERETIRTGRAQRRRDARHRTKVRRLRERLGLSAVNAANDTSPARPGRPRETSLRVLVSQLGAIYNAHTGRWPGRTFDRNPAVRARRNVGKFEEFVYGVVRLLYPDDRDPLTFDHFIKWYASELKRGRNSRT